MNNFGRIIRMGSVLVRPRISPHCRRDRKSVLAFLAIASQVRR